MGNDVVMHTDRQLQDYLLCPRCEDILNKGGETWTIPKLATVRHNFPLYDSLTKCPPAGGDKGGALYSTANNPEIDVERLTHFAMGIFWKASVHPWKDREKSPMIQLGPYSDGIRLWLRGELAFPKNVCLGVMLSRPERSLIALSGPVETYQKGWRAFLLYVPGAAFTLYVGKLIDPLMRETCFHEGPLHLIVVSDEVTDLVWQKLGAQYHESRKTKRYLAAKAARSLKRGDST